jgi:hypothetical protein
MKKVLNENQIVESMPIMGIYNKVINSGLEIVPQVEFYAFDPNELDKFLQLCTTSGTKFLYDFIITRAKRLKSLEYIPEAEDYRIGMKSQLKKQENSGALFFEGLLGLGIMKEFVTVDLQTCTFRREDFTGCKLPL